MRSLPFKTAKLISPETKLKLPPPSAAADYCVARLLQHSKFLLSQEETLKLLYI